MTQMRFLGACLGAAMVLAASGTWRAGAQDSTPLTAKVVKLSGTARVSEGGKPWQMLKVGDVLKPGSLVQTSKTKSTLDLQLSEGSAVRLYDDSALEIKTLAVKGAGEGRVEELELDLKAGQILGVVKKFQEGSDYRVMVPTGAAGIRGSTSDARGTAYVLKSSGALTVLAGKMVIAIASDNTVAQVVEAEQQFDPATGKVEKLAADAPERKLWK
jgi:hypothetical protein